MIEIPKWIAVGVAFSPAIFFMLGAILARQSFRTKSYGKTN